MSERYEWYSIIWVHIKNTKKQVPLKSARFALEHQFEWHDRNTKENYWNSRASRSNTTYIEHYTSHHVILWLHRHNLELEFVTRNSAVEQGNSTQFGISVKFPAWHLASLSGSYPSEHEIEQVSPLGVPVCSSVGVRSNILVWYNCERVGVMDCLRDASKYSVNEWKR